MIIDDLPYNGTTYQLIRDDNSRTYYITVNNKRIAMIHALSDEEAVAQFEFKVPFLHQKGNKMDETQKILKQLEEEHRKAMEGINAMNKAMHENIDAMHSYTGVPKK